MDIIDLGRLTPTDFEALAQDLWAAESGQQLELFGPGADNGIDLRYVAVTADDTTIGQCKHYFKSGYSGLLSAMKKEKAKVDDLAPDRYLLFTSAQLTPGNKTSLKEELDPWIKAEGDIFGGDDVLALLRKHPMVVKQHIRLWLSSQEVLKALLENRVHQRSKQLEEDAREAALVYVPNPSLDRATDVLRSQKVCLISGIPGIGKTTLAMVIAATYAAEGWSIVNIGSDIDEGWQLWDENPTVKQLFYYDDFLGQTSLSDKLNKNEDERILNFMRRVSKAPNRRFILTTREYILEHARARYEKLKYFDFDPFQCVVAMADYGALDQARLLYNHLYFAELPDATLGAFSSSANLRAIVEHKNFSPRIIAVSIGLVETSGVEGSDAVDVMKVNLANPSRIWSSVVEDQLSDIERQILQVLRTLPASALVDDVRLSVDSLARLTGSSPSVAVVNAALRTLDGSLVRIDRNSDSGDLQIRLISPALRDYLTLHFIQHAPDLPALIAESASFYEQAQVLASITSEDGNAIVDEEFLRRRLVDLISAPPVWTPYVAYASHRMYANRLTALLDRFPDIPPNELLSAVASTVDSLEASGPDITAIRLANRLAGIDNDGVKELGERLAQGYADYLVGTASTPFEAQDYLRQARQLEPAHPGLVRQLEEIFQGAAERALDELMEAGDDDIDLDSAYSLLDVYENVLFDGAPSDPRLDEVRQRLEEGPFEEDPDFEHDDRDRDPDPGDEDATWDEIESMFDTLGQD